VVRSAVPNSSPLSNSNGVLRMLQQSSVTVLSCVWGLYHGTVGQIAVSVVP
jgi:hypothetical protein